MAGADNYSTSDYDFDRGGSNVITPAATATGTVVSFDQSNKSTLGTCNIYFVLGDTSRMVMKLKDAVVNEAGIDFEIDGIATINWSGHVQKYLISLVALLKILFNLLMVTPQTMEVQSQLEMSGSIQMIAIACMYLQM